MPVPRWAKVATFGVSVISSQFLLDLNLGNVSLIVTFLAVVAWRWLDKPISGLAMAASVTVRPAMGVIWLWWIIRRQWVAVIWTVLGGARQSSLRVFLSWGYSRGSQFVTVLRNISDVDGVPAQPRFRLDGAFAGLTSRSPMSL